MNMTNSAYLFMDSYFSYFNELYIDFHKFITTIRGSYNQLKEYKGKVILLLSIGIED